MILVSKTKEALVKVDEKYGNGISPTMRLIVAAMAQNHGGTAADIYIGNDGDWTSIYANQAQYMAPP